MPNGICYRPYRIPGKYTCYLCKELKDAEEFYKDSSRYNGCCSRCKQCEGSRDNSYKWSKRQIEKRVEEIKSDYKVVQRDKTGLPVFIEKTTYFSDGNYETVFVRGVGG